MNPLRRPARSPAPSSRYGVIDIGTNAVKLVVGSVENGRVVAHHFGRRPTRLGERLHASGRIRADAARRTTAAVRELADEARAHGAERVVAGGTYALRSASNGRAVAELIKRQSGIPVRILSSSQEGKLALVAVQSRMTASAVLDLAVVDIGGGSAQLTVARGKNLRARSVPLGAVVLTEHYLRHDPIQPGEYARLQTHVDDVVSGLFTGHALHVARQSLVVAGGAASTALRMLGVPPRRRMPSISLAQLKRLERMCLSATIAERREFPGMTPDRADIMPAGLAVLIAFARHARRRSIRVFEGGWREGLILEQARRARARTRSTARVRAAARKDR
jgi:exopolyphosphatase/guanosine-5'-triphosphate,3'-diphosphate pyrophosphatase